MEKDREFTVKDIYLASLIYAKGVKLARVDREGRQCWFIFEEKERSEELQKMFFSKEVEVNAKDYADAIRTLKDLIFS